MGWEQYLPLPPTPPTHFTKICFSSYHNNKNHKFFMISIWFQKFHYYKFKTGPYLLSLSPLLPLSLQLMLIGFPSTPLYWNVTLKFPTCLHLAGANGQLSAASILDFSAAFHCHDFASWNPSFSRNPFPQPNWVSFCLTGCCLSVSFVGSSPSGPLNVALQSRLLKRWVEF